MTNKEFLLEVQKSCHIENAQCVLLLNSLQKVLAKAAVDQVPVVMPGLGVFTSHKHPEYIQEDQQTGAMTLYPPRISYRMQTENYDDAVQVSVLLSEYGKISESVSSSLISSIVNIVNETLARGEEIEVPCLGTFARVLTHNSELQHVEYTPDEQMKELVNAPFSCFEPVVISEGEAAPAAVVAEEEVASPEEEMIVSLEKEVIVEEPVQQEATEEPVAEIEEEPVVVEPEPTPVVEDKPVVESKPIIAEIRKDKEDKSTNRLLYAAIALVLVGCGFLVWLLFCDDDYIESQEAVVVSEEPVQPSLPESEIVPQDTVVVEEIAQNVVETKEEVPPVVKEDVLPAKEEIKKVAVEIKTEPKPVKQEAPKDYHRMMGADGNPVTVKLQVGERLTIIALNQFGDKAFWPYIFDANADRLKAPNLVQAGMTLYLPDPAYYGIDVNDPESLRKAKNRGAQLLK